MILPGLELKFVLHHGTFVLQPVAGQVKLVGPAINLAHRLLKNTVTERTGRRAYLLVTDAAATRLHMGVGIGEAHEEQYPDAGRVSALLVSLEAESSPIEREAPTH